MKHQLTFVLHFSILKLRKLFIRELTECKSLIVHSHLTWPFIYVPFAASGLNVILFYTEHGTTNWRRRFKLLKFFDRFIYAKYDSIICISSGVEESLQFWLGQNSAKEPIELVYNGANFYGYKQRSQLSKKINFISVGSLFPTKGFDRAISALAHLKEYDWHYTIVGTGPMLIELKALASSLGLDGKVTFFGWSDNISELFYASNIQLIPSRWEGFGLVAVEGMSTGLPIIGSNIKGLNEVLIGKHSSFLVNNPDDHLEWIEKIELCIKSLEVSVDLVARDALATSEMFSLDRMVKSYNELYIKNIGS